MRRDHSAIAVALAAAQALGARVLEGPQDAIRISDRPYELTSCSAPLPDSSEPPARSRKPTGVAAAKRRKKQSRRRR